jgi:hypothetical protein
VIVMNGPTADQPARNEDARAVTSVAELAQISAWTVTSSRGHWTTAERILHLGGQRWVVGLTPTASGATALILWCDGDIVAHNRGTEAALCGTAIRWVNNLLVGRPWDAH